MARPRGPRRPLGPLPGGRATVRDAGGDARFDDALPDQAEDGRTERHRVHAGLLAAAGGIDAARLVPEERRALALATALARAGSSAAWSTA